jgi:hypothetical protein
VNAATFRALAALGPGGDERPAPSSHSPTPRSSPTAPPDPEAPVSAPIWKKALFAALAAGVVGGGALLLRRKG